jgi:hypothetical protein
MNVDKVKRGIVITSSHMSILDQTVSQVSSTNRTQKNANQLVQLCKPPVGIDKTLTNYTPKRDVNFIQHL